MLNNFSTLHQFVREEITNDVFRQNFISLQNITSWNIPNVNIKLSDILTDKFVNQYHRICGFYNLTPIRDTIEVIKLQEHWANCHKKTLDNTI